MLIRRMTISDVPVVAEIEKECFSMPWSMQSLKESIEREDTLFLVCVDTFRKKEFCDDTALEATVEAQMIVGYIGMYLSFDEGDITNVAVASQYRKKGYGEALVSSAKTFAEEKLIERILLEVRVSNAPAISLYKKMGFEELGLRKKFYEHPVEDALIMSCTL